tara:strand:+ start:3817 stop:4509 length:693 start_codon:yes stop_codon:yes gene_type:complete
MSFKKNGYAIIKQAVNEETANVLYNYFLVKKQVYDTMRQKKYMSVYEQGFGFYEKEWQQVPEAFCVYGDQMFDTIMLKCQPIMEKTTGLKLQPSYSFGRIYKKNQELKRHKDRINCEISTTMNLGGDNWTIYLDPTGEDNLINGTTQLDPENKRVKKGAPKGIGFDLKPGDMLVYRGCDFEHWRKKFKGDQCVQLFLHYNNTKTPETKKLLYDTRPHIGLPGWFKNEVNN